MSEHLTCKICGYKQFDNECCEYYKNKYKNMDLHDIPYICGACQNTEDFTDNDFIDDKEKMRDFIKLSKEEFLQSYSYLTEEEYNNTLKIYKQFYI